MVKPQNLIHFPLHPLLNSQLEQPKVLTAQLVSRFLAFSGRFPLSCMGVGATRVVQSSLSHRAAVLEAADTWLDYEESTLEM